MPKEKHIVILANSVRAKKYCVAGKVVSLKGSGKFDVGEWIRFADPKDSQGAVSYVSTVCEVNGLTRPVRPLDIVKVTFTGSCGNPDHPEDFFFDPLKRWQIIGKATHENLSELQDAPQTLWHDGTEAKSVPAGYVSKMGNDSASLYLIKAPKNWSFTFWKHQIPDADNSGQMKTKQHRELSFQFNKRYHEFSVTDPEFTKRHKIYDRMTDMPQLLKVLDSTNVFFCLSLTPEFRKRHYKIAATIFEPSL
jgi:hypothetical protein